MLYRICVRHYRPESNYGRSSKSKDGAQMILTRTPFRMTLGGGGTDLPSFYREHGGFILAVTIDKFMYLNVNTPIVDDFVRVRYNRAETVIDVDQVEHTLAREALRRFRIRRGIEIVSIADIPAGTGL